MHFMHVVIVFFLQVRAGPVLDTMNVSYHGEFHFFIKGGWFGAGLHGLRGGTPFDINF